MAARKEKKQTDPTTELVRDLLIAQLGLAGVAQQEIRKIAGCDMKRVTRIVKPINKAKQV
jgi:hypothetical protein